MRLGDILVATNSALLAEAVFGLLGEGVSRCAIVVGDVDEFARRLKTAAPSTAFVEACFWGARTAELVHSAAQQYRGLHIAVWSAACLSASVAARFVMAGAESYVDLRGGKGDLMVHMAKIVAGGSWLPKDVENALGGADAAPDFANAASKREREVIKLTIAGKSTGEIAAALGVGVHAVKKHRANIYAKCQGNTIVDLIRYGLHTGVVSPEDF